jgi:hypothetical protein
MQRVSVQSQNQSNHDKRHQQNRLSDPEEENYLLLQVLHLEEGHTKGKDVKELQN